MQLTRLSLSATPGPFVNVGSKLVRVSERYTAIGSEDSEQEVMGASSAKLSVVGASTEKFELVGE